MRIKLGFLRRIIREEVQRLVEGEAVDPYGPTFEGPVPKKELGRFDKPLVQRVLDKAEELFPNIEAAAGNDDHDDAETIFLALYEIMDTIHYAFSAIKNIPKTYMNRLVKNYRYFDNVKVRGSVDQTAEDLIRKKMESAIDLLKDDVIRLEDVDSCGKALADFSDDVKSAMENLERSNKRLSSNPPPPRR